MANTPEGKKLTEAYRQAQLSLRADITARGKLLSHLLSPSDLDGSARIYVPAMTEVIRAGSEANQMITAKYVEEHAVAEIGQKVTAATPDFDEVAATLDMQIRGPIEAKIQIGKGFDPATAVEKATRLATVGAGRDVLDFGRRIIISTAAQMESELGKGYRGRWRRVTDGKPCAFCGMLAGRGPVYAEDTVDFDPHDLCGCCGELVYGGWEPTELERRWREAYVDAANEASAMDGVRVAPKRSNGKDTVLWRMRRDNPDLFHDGWKPLRPSTDQLPLATTAKQEARKLLAEAKAIEPAVTKTFESLATNHGGILTGLDHRLKTEESLTRKIAGDAAAKSVPANIVARDISDSLRYTMLLDERSYSAGVEETLTALRSAGWDARVKNYWASPEVPYQGVNVALTTPEGMPVELQFHTQTSFRVKEFDTHDVYEKQRLLTENSDEWKALSAEMNRAFSKIPVPPGVNQIE